ncbi:MAG: hypothetical protein ACRD4X_14715 [Candidatus Acidiferrales bacterium]
MTKELTNPFERANAARHARAEKAAAESAAAKQKAREQAERRKTPGAERGPGGFLIDARTVAARDAYFAEKRAQQEAKSAPQAHDAGIGASTELSESELISIFDGWVSQNPTFYNPLFNRSQMTNILLTAIRDSWNGVDGWNFRSLTAVFLYAQKENFVEGPPVRLRGSAREVPRVFPEFRMPLSPNEIAAQEQQRIDGELARQESEREAAKKMTFAELEKAARSKYNYKRAAARDGVTHV